MHPTIIARILDLAATKVAAQFDHHTVIDQAADCLLAKVDRKAFAREVAERIDSRDLVREVIDHLDTDTIAEKAAERIDIDEQEVIAKAVEEVVGSYSQDDLTEALTERLLADGKFIDRSAGILVDRVCAALTEADGTVHPNAAA
jgi:hypothetical protein